MTESCLFHNRVAASPLLYNNIKENLNKTPKKVFYKNDIVLDDYARLQDNNLPPVTALPIRLIY